MTIDAQSSLDLRMTYMMDRGKITWDVGGLKLKPDRDKKTFVAAYRQPKPGEDAGKQLRDRWDHMRKRDEEFNGKPGTTTTSPTTGSARWRGRMAVRESPAPPQYELVYNIDRALLPRELEDLGERLAAPSRSPSN